LPSGPFSECFHPCSLSSRRKALQHLPMFLRVPGPDQSLKTIELPGRRRNFKLRKGWKWALARPRLFARLLLSCQIQRDHQKNTCRLFHVCSPAHRPATGPLLLFIKTNTLLPSVPTYTCPGRNGSTATEST